MFIAHFACARHLGGSRQTALGREIGLFNNDVEAVSGQRGLCF